MKSVLFLIPTLMGGGAERVLVNLVNNLDKSKFDVSLQTLFDVGVNRQFLNADVHYIPGLSFIFRGNVTLMKLFSPLFLYKRIIKRRFDIIVSYMEGPTARILSGCPYSDTKKISWIHTDHKSVADAIGSFRNYDEAKMCYSRFDSSVCVSEQSSIDFEKIFGIKNQVIYNVIEDDVVRKRAEESFDDLSFSDQYNIVSLGKLHPVKGFERLINVHKRLMDEGLHHHVYIIGKGEEQKNLAAQIKQENVENTFHLVGFRDNPYKYLKKADIYICSSWREGFSTAVTEALVLGIPCVSTCCSGAYELLGSNNEYGIVTANTEDGLYKGLKQLLTNNAVFEHYQSQAKQRGFFFSKERRVKDVEVLFDTI